MTKIEESIVVVAEKYLLPEPECGWEEHDRRISAIKDAELNAERAAMVERRLFAMGVPASFHAVILGGPEVTAALEAMRKLIRSRGCLAVLSGSVGCGKTVAAATWLLHAPIDIGSHRKDTKARRFIAASEFCQISPYDAQQFESITKAAVLVLDDLGQEFADKRSYFTQRIDDLVARRHGDMLPTVITTNLSIQQVRDTYGDRVASRFNDAQVTLLRGEPDRRQR